MEEVPKKFARSDYKMCVRPIDPSETDRWQVAMRASHFLGDAGLMGEQIRYVVELDGRWCALVAWAQAALKLEARDRWIGWLPEHRVKRLKFVVNNQRFLILPEFSGFKNLASSALALNLSRLSIDWQKRYGHSVLMTETFVDPARHSGSCYRAQGWELVGLSKGFSKIPHVGYSKHGLGKLIFVKPLSSWARTALGGSCPHPALFENPHSFRRYPMIDTNLVPLFGRGGLVELCGNLPDGRSRFGKRYPTAGLTAACALATMSGARTFKGISLWVQALPTKTLADLKLWRAPSVSTVRRHLIGLDAPQTDVAIHSWMNGQDSLTGKAIALDGKTIRRSAFEGGKNITLLSAVLHEEGQVIAQKRVSEKTNEIPVAQQMLEELDIRGCVITADALHSQTKTAETIKKTAPITSL